MAGDWIKMRGNLWDDPRVARICDLTDASEATVVGALYWLWATADQHSEDGVMEGLTLRAIDRKTGVKGFGEALVTIGWLADNPEGVRIVRFDEHNGASAKKRIQTAKRVANHKASNAEETSEPAESNAQVTHVVTSGNAVSVTEALAVRDLEIEKRREEEKALPPQASATATPRKPEPRATRIPDDWSLTPELSDIGRLTRREAGLPEIDLRLEAAKFVDFWRAKSGKDATKLDWTATWRNWCRNATAKTGTYRAASPDPIFKTAQELGL